MPESAAEVLALRVRRAVVAARKFRAPSPPPPYVTPQSEREEGDVLAGRLSPGLVESVLSRIEPAVTRG